MIRSLIFRLQYCYYKLFKRNLKLKGFCVIFSFPGSCIKLRGGYDKLLVHKQYARVVATDDYGCPLWG